MDSCDPLKNVKTRKISEDYTVLVVESPRQDWESLQKKKKKPSAFTCWYGEKGTRQMYGCLLGSVFTCCSKILQLGSASFRVTAWVTSESSMVILHHTSAYSSQVHAICVIGTSSTRLWQLWSLQWLLGYRIAFALLSCKGRKTQTLHIDPSTKVTLTQWLEVHCGSAQFPLHPLCYMF